MNSDIKQDAKDMLTRQIEILREEFARAILKQDEGAIFKARKELETFTSWIKLLN